MKALAILTDPVYTKAAARSQLHCWLSRHECRADPGGGLFRPAALAESVVLPKLAGEC